MPTVPTEQNRIGLASASGEKLHPGDYRDTGLEALGTGLSQLGGSGMAVAQEAHRRFVVDDTAVKSAWNGYSRASRAVLDGLQRDTGDPGASGAATQQMLGELRGQVLAGLGNDRQRALAARSIDERLGIDALKIQGIVDGKRAAARERETDQLRETSADDAVAHAEDHMLSEKFAQTGEGTFGTAPEALHYRSGINLRIADARTRSDPLAAKAWLERNRETMTPEDIATAEQGLAAPLADLRAVADADAPLLARAPLAPVTPPMGELEAKMRTITPQGLSDGKDGLSSLVQRYKGDAAKAWGAMLLGADTLDATIAREGDGWFASLPDNERGFIAENMALLGATASPRAAASPGQGEEQRNWIEAQPWNEERKARALDELEQRDAREAQRRTQAASAAKDAAYALTDQLGSGFTSIAQLPPEMRRALDDETQAALTRQAKANAKPVPVVSQGTTAHDLTKLAATDRQGFVNTDLRLHRDQVTPEEYDALVTAQQGWRASPPAIPAVTGQRAWEAIRQSVSELGLGGNDLRGDVRQHFAILDPGEQGTASPLQNAVLTSGEGGQPLLDIAEKRSSSKAPPQEQGRVDAPWLPAPKGTYVTIEPDFVKEFRKNNPEFVAKEKELFDQSLGWSWLPEKMFGKYFGPLEHALLVYQRVSDGRIEMVTYKAKPEEPNHIVFDEKSLKLPQKKGYRLIIAEHTHPFPSNASMGRTGVPGPSNGDMFYVKDNPQTIFIIRSFFAGNALLGRELVDYYFGNIK